MKVKSHACHYYEGYEQKAQKQFDDTPVIDIEDLVSKGSAQKFCPYYASRLHKNRAQVLFSPYNYLLVPSLRGAQNLDLRNSVVIFDEGHNIENICEESASTGISSQSLALCIKETTRLLEMARNHGEDQTPGDTPQDQADLTESNRLIDGIEEIGTGDMIFVKDVLCDLLEAVDSELDSGPLVHDEKKLTSGWLFQTMEQTLCLKKDFVEKLLVTVDRMCLLLSQNPVAGSRVNMFESLKDFFKIIFPADMKPDAVDGFRRDFAKNYRILLSIVDETKGYQQQKRNGWIVASKNEEDRKSWVLNLYCLSPSVAMKQLLAHGVQSIIITSGTLAPLDSFQHEMDIPFKFNLENRHVITEKQLKVRTIVASRTGVMLNSKYGNRTNAEYYRALGQTLADYSRVIPGGLLVFFSSYSSLAQTVDYWKRLDFWDKIQEHKLIFQEPKDKTLFADSLTRFKDQIDSSSRGAMFLGVVRGKLSEGLDIGNDYCRAVVMIGLPFPSYLDTRTQLKKEYLESKRIPHFSHSEYYSLQMKRALNQAIGRVIRHKEDFGVILLLDYRFPDHQDSLSKWIRPFFASKGYQETLTEIRMVFDPKGGSSPSLDQEEEETLHPKATSKPFVKPVRTPSVAPNRFMDGGDVKQLLTDYRRSGSYPTSGGPSFRRKPDHNSRSPDPTKPGRFFAIFDKQQGLKKKAAKEKQEEENQRQLSLKRETLEKDQVDSTFDEDPEDETMKSALRISQERKKFKTDLSSLKMQREEEQKTHGSQDSKELLRHFLQNHGKDVSTLNQRTLIFRHLVLFLPSSLMMFQLMGLLGGSQGWKKLTDALETYNSQKNIHPLIGVMSQIFSDVVSPKRELYISGIAIILKEQDRPVYFERLKVDLSHVPKSIYSGSVGTFTRSASS